MIKFNKDNFDLVGAAMKQKAALAIYADTAAKKMEGEAKSKAPWIDRTSNARQSISGNHGWDGKTLKIVLSGGMNYSVYLELAYEKRYAILVPTIERNAPEILRGYQKLVKS